MQQPASDLAEHSITQVSKAFDISIATLRYYEDLGLIAPTSRRGRVRYYDEDSLVALAYVQLWHEDALLTLGQTAAIAATVNRRERVALLRRHSEQLRAQAARMEAAAQLLDHLQHCRSATPIACPVTGAALRERVRSALAG